MYVKLLYDPERKFEIKNEPQKKLGNLFPNCIFLYEFEISPIQTISNGDNILLKFGQNNFLLRIVDTIFLKGEKFYIVDFVFYSKNVWANTPNNTQFIKTFLESQWRKIEIKQQSDIWEICKLH